MNTASNSSPSLRNPPHRRTLYLAMGTAASLMLASSHPASAQAKDGTTTDPSSPPSEMTQAQSVQKAYQEQMEIRRLIIRARYEEALQRCLAYRKQFKESRLLNSLLPEWMDLGAKYPKARTELIKIRDQDVREFSEGRGFYDLFREISYINRALQQEEATCKFFKSLSVKDPSIAHQCYPVVEKLFVSRGEYRLCFDQLGDLEEKLESLHKNLVLKQAFQKRMAAFQERKKQTPALSGPNRSSAATNTWATLLKSAEDNFVDQVQLLIEILVATDHKEQAIQVRDQAVAMLNDTRLKTAVADAEARLRSKPPLR